MQHRVIKPRHDLSRWILTVSFMASLSFQLLYFLAAVCVSSIYAFVPES